MCRGVQNGSTILDLSAMKGRIYILVYALSKTYISLFMMVFLL